MTPDEFLIFVGDLLLRGFGLILEYSAPVIGFLVIGYLIYLWKFKPKHKDDLLEYRKTQVRLAKKNKMSSFPNLKKLYRLEVDVNEILKRKGLTIDEKKEVLNALRTINQGVYVGDIVGFNVIDLKVTKADLMNTYQNISEDQQDDRKFDYAQVIEVVNQMIKEAGDLMYVIVYKQRINMLKSTESVLLLLKNQIGNTRDLSGNLCVYGYGFEDLGGFEIITGWRPLRDLFSLDIPIGAYGSLSMAIVGMGSEFMEKSTGLDTSTDKEVKRLGAIMGSQNMQKTGEE